MLQEMVQYGLTRCHPAARRLGYLYEFIAIGARYRRCRKAWQPHLEHTREAIRRWLGGLPVGLHLAILGGGWLHDIPLEEAAAHSGRITLVDLAFSRDTLRRTRRLAHAEAVYADLTGCLSALVSQRSDIRNLPNPVFNLPPEAAKADALLSVNLLSQLPVLPLERLESLGATPASRRRFAHLLQSTHVQGLRRHGRALLITDSHEYGYHDGDASSSPRNVMPLLYAMEAILPPPEQEWEWQLQPPGEGSGPYAAIRRVGCWRWPAGN